MLFTPHLRDVAYAAILFLALLLFDVRSSEAEFLRSGPVKPTGPEVRVALVIGNSSYRTLRALKNPRNDGELVAAALRKIGFHVTFLPDLDRNRFQDAVRSFAIEASKADVAFFYYAGIGFDGSGEHYVVPVDAPYNSPFQPLFGPHPNEFGRSVLQLQSIVRVVHAKWLNIFVFDDSRGVLGGHDEKPAPIEPDRNTIVAFSTRGGNDATEGNGANGPYAKALAARLTQPGLDISAIFRAVRDDVRKATNGQQEPSAFENLPSEAYYLIKPAPVASAASCAAVAAGRPPQAGKFSCLALVLGNSAYVHEHTLTNPQNDANDVAGALRGLGFRLIGDKAWLNVNYNQMHDLLREMNEQAANADVALLYYAGHGVENKGRNYLVPVDAKLLREDSLSAEGFALLDVVANLSPAKYKIIVLDACRTADFPLVGPSGGRRGGAVRGLRREEAPDRTLIAFSASQGQVARDGEGRNSPYAASLLRHLRDPGISVPRVFERVTDDFRPQAHSPADEDAQRPMYSSQLGDVNFELVP